MKMKIIQSCEQLGSLPVDIMLKPEYHVIDWPDLCRDMHISCPVHPIGQGGMEGNSIDRIKFKKKKLMNSFCFLKVCFK